MTHPALCFINYRRLDTGGHAGGLKDKLELWYHPSHLFYDNQSIDHGADFPAEIAQGIARAKVFLVLIGPDWLTTLDRYRDEQRNDWVKQEILLALAKRERGEELAIIPLLVGGAAMPDAELLPIELQQFSRQYARHALSLPGNADAVDSQFQGLLRLLEQHGLPPARFRPPEGAPRPFHTLGRVPSANFHDPLAHLAQIYQVLTREGTAALLTSALHGMGGVGKTQMALQYSHVFQANYAGVWWLRAEDPALLELDCLEMVEANQIPYQKGQSVAPAIQRWLATQPPWLLVYDNAEEVAMVKPFLPNRGQHHVLITSRRPDWQTLAGATACIRLAHWTPEHALAFMRKRLPGADPDALRQIALALGGLPLALEQAAAYIDTGAAGAAEYAGFLADADTHAVILAMTSDADERSVLQTLSLSLKKLSPAAHQLLNLCALCAPEPIPENLFQAHPDLLAEPLHGSCNGVDWAEVVKQLHRLSLVERDAARQSLTLHRLTQAAVRLCKPSTAGVAVGADTADRPEADAAIPDLLRLLQADFPAAPDQPNNWPYCGTLLPHIKQMTRFGALPAATATVETYCALLDAAAWYLRAGPALYAESRQLSLLALPLLAEALGAEHADVLVIKGNLAQTLGDQGDLAGARDLQDQVCAASIRVLGPEHPDTLTASSNLALTLCAQGDFAGARALLEQTLSISRRVLGPTHFDTITCINNLALTLHALGDMAGARGLLVEALDVLNAAQGPEHPATLTSMANLAEILRSQGDLAGAKDTLVQEIAICKRVLGPEHPTTIASMNNLAFTLGDLGDLPDAKQLLLQVIAVRRRILGPEHPATLASMSYLAGLHRKQGDLPGARQVLEQIRDARIKVLGPEHPDTLTGISELAIVLRHQGELDEAKRLHVHVRDIRRRVLGPEHPDTLVSINNLAEVSRDQGDWDGVRELQTEVLNASVRLLGPEHLDTLASMNNLAGTLAHQGDLAGARALQERVLACHQRLLGPDHLATVTSMNNLAGTLRYQGDLDGARQLQVQVFDALKRLHGQEHTHTTIAAWNLFETLHKMRAQGAAQELLSNHLQWLLEREPGALSAAQNSIRVMVADLLKPPPAPLPSNVRQLFPAKKKN